MRVRNSTILLFLFTLSVALPSYSQGRSRVGNTATQPQEKDQSVVGDVERIIREWFGHPHNLEGLPPGLAKRDSLPPGLQRQLYRNGHLPPGLEKKIHNVPDELVILLPRLPKNRRWIFIAGNVILLDETTSTIVDIIRRVF